MKISLELCPDSNASCRWPPGSRWVGVARKKDVTFFLRRKHFQSPSIAGRKPFRLRLPGRQHGLVNAQARPEVQCVLDSAIAFYPAFDRVIAGFSARFDRACPARPRFRYTYRAIWLRHTDSARFHPDDHLPGSICARSAPIRITATTICLALDSLQR